MKDHSGNGALKLPRIFALRMAAAFLMRYGYDAVYSVCFRLDMPHVLGDPGRNMTGAIRGGDNGDVIARPDIAILALITHKGRHLLRREELSDRRPRRVFILAPAEIRHRVMR